MHDPLVREHPASRMSNIRCPMVPRPMPRRRTRCPWVARDGAIVLDPRQDASHAGLQERWWRVISEREPCPPGTLDVVVHAREKSRLEEEHIVWDARSSWSGSA